MSRTVAHARRLDDMHARDFTNAVEHASTQPSLTTEMAGIDDGDVTTALKVRRLRGCRRTRTDGMGPRCRTARGWAAAGFVLGRPEFNLVRCRPGIKLGEHLGPFADRISVLIEVITLQPLAECSRASVDELVIFLLLGA